MFEGRQLLRVWGTLIAGVLAALISVGIASKAEGATTIKVCGSGNGHARIVKSYYRGATLKKFADNPPVGVLLGQKPLTESIG